MPAPPTDLEALLARARAGCPDASRTLVERYSDTIRRVVRHALSQRLRPLLDSDDFLQDVWADFFSRVLQQHVFENLGSSSPC